MNDILALQKQVRDLKLYIAYLEGELDAGSTEIDWCDVVDLMFSKPIVCGRINDDSLSTFTVELE